MMTTNILLTLIAVLAMAVMVLLAINRRLFRAVDEQKEKRMEDRRNATLYIEELRANGVSQVSLLPDPLHNAWSVSIWKMLNDGSTTYIDVKSFPYNPLDKEDIAYAKLCAEELKEAIEYDWKIKNYMEG